MIDPIFTASLTAKSLSDLAKSELLHVTQNLVKRATRAKEKHILIHSKSETPIEVFRDQCLGKVCNLQHEIILCVSDSEFLKNSLPLLLEHIGTIYEADTIRELTIIDMSLSRIENALTSYKQEKERRKKIRMWAVALSLGAFVAMGLFIFVGSKYFYITNTFSINILKIPVPVLLWSIIGSCAAILYRFTNAGDKELNEPLRWLYARPLTGVIMGVISYLVLKVGLITIQGGGSTIANPEVISLIAFLAGFSDRFSESLLRTIVGKFGGDKEGELVSMEVRAESTRVESSTTIQGNLATNTEIPADTIKEAELIDKEGVEITTGVLPETTKESQSVIKTLETNEIEVNHKN